MLSVWPRWFALLHWPGLRVKSLRKTAGLFDGGEREDLVRCGSYLSRHLQRRKASCKQTTADVCLWALAAPEASVVQKYGKSTTWRMSKPPAEHMCLLGVFTAGYIMRVGRREVCKSVGVLACLAVRELVDWLPKHTVKVPGNRSVAVAGCWMQPLPTHIPPPPPPPASPSRRSVV